MGVVENLHLSSLEPELRYVIYFLVTVHVAVVVRCTSVAVVAISLS